MSSHVLNILIILLLLIQIKALVKYGRTDCLSHDLCSTLLKRKWNRYGLMLHLIDSMKYLLFLFALTLIVITYPICIHENMHSDMIYNNQNRSLCEEYINSNSVYYVIYT